MVKSFLQRWLPGIFGKVGHRSPAPATERRATNLSARDEVQTIAEVGTMSARRPLISSSGDVAGFEFRIAESVAQHLKRQGDTRVRAGRVAALFATAYVIAQTHRIGFARLPAQWLVHAMEMEVGPGLLIGLEFNPDDLLSSQAMMDIECAVLGLRSRGVQVGWGLECDQNTKPDFVFLRQGASPMSVLLDSMAAWPTELQGLPVLVTDISNVEELEMALYYGVKYACGLLDNETASSQPAVKHQVPPEVKRVGLLLKRLVSGADTEEIVGQIKGDVGLSYRLLSRINSASYAQLGNCSSLEHAVLLVGRYELYRWLSMLLVQFAGSRKASPALQEMTLWRSRLLELMAIERHEVSPDQFFTLGLASMLGQLLKISQAEVVSTLNLPTFASQALLEHAGPWYPYLQVARYCEAQSLDQSAELVALFGGMSRMMYLSDQAWLWAAEQTAHTDARNTAPQQ